MKNTRKILFSAALLSSGLTMAQTTTAEKSPNVIYIMADDLGIGDLGCYGQRQIKTPNIDGIAQNGMKFMQHYSGSTVSAPGPTNFSLFFHQAREIEYGALCWKSSGFSLSSLSNG